MSVHISGSQYLLLNNWMAEEVAAAPTCFHVLTSLWLQEPQCHRSSVFGTDALVFVFGHERLETSKASWRCRERLALGPRCGCWNAAKLFLWIGLLKQIVWKNQFVKMSFHHYNGLQNKIIIIALWEYRHFGTLKLWTGNL